MVTMLRDLIASDSSVSVGDKRQQAEARDRLEGKLATQLSELTYTSKPDAKDTAAVPSTPPLARLELHLRDKSRSINMVAKASQALFSCAGWSTEYTHFHDME